MLRIRSRVLSLEQDIYSNPISQAQGASRERRQRELKAGEGAAECCLLSTAALNPQLWLPHKNYTRSRQHNSSTDGVHDLWLPSLAEEILEVNCFWDWKSFFEGVATGRPLMFHGRPYTNTHMGSTNRT